MQHPLRRSYFSLWLALVAGALAFAANGSRAWAQCPSGSATITRPNNGASSLSGTSRVDISLTGAGGSYYWDHVTVNIYNQFFTLVKSDNATIVSSTQAAYPWVSSQLPDGAYWLTVAAFLNDGFGKPLRIRRRLAQRHVAEPLLRPARVDIQAAPQLSAFSGAHERKHRSAGG